MSATRSRGRAVARIAGAAVILAALLAASPRPVAADAPTGPLPVLIDVQGGPIGSLSTAPLALSPAFSTTTYDYVVRCAPGTNDITLTVDAAAGHSVAYGTRARPTATAAVSLIEGQALVVESDAQGPSAQYWIRCLPHDFPPIDVSRPGSPAPGWYLTGTISAGNTGTAPDGRYAMILDTNGTPVWYAAAPSGADLVQPVPPASISYSGLIDPFHDNPGYQILALDGSASTSIKAVGTPTDNHELLLLPNGNRAVLAYPMKRLSPTQTIVDCEVQELDSSDNLVWSWTASDHVGISESLRPGQGASDVFHCNSVDEDATGSNILVSFRQLDAVLDIDRTTKHVVWKLGGSAPIQDPQDGTTPEHITVDSSDPEGGPSGQHDARFQAGGEISLYDDETYTNGPTSIARGVIYSLDHTRHTASMVAEYANPLGTHSLFTGSFRPYSDGSNVVGWGGLPHGSGFTDFDSGDHIQFAVGFPNQDLTYRALKAPPSAYDVNLLRRTSGLNSQAPPATQPPPTQPTMGYWLVASDGGVFPIGNARGFGSTGAIRLNRPIVGAVAAPDEGGYWLVASDGGVFPFGDAIGYGSTGSVHLNQPIVSMASTPGGRGYWLVASDGGVFPFGDAVGYGSTGSVRLNQPIVGMASTPDGAGYWLIAADGGIFPFGDAPGRGSTGGVHLNSHIVGMTPTPDGGGYWLVAADGGVFPLGDAVGYGAMGGTHLNAPIIGITTSPDGGGYWLAGADGAIFPFGDAVGYGSLGSARLNRPVVAITA